jgi:hypothetical protein
MKNFKDMWEDAAANSVGGGGVSMPSGVSSKKDKKKKIYDGRTKEGRKFVERILARRRAAENKRAKNETV